MREGVQGSSGSVFVFPGSGLFAVGRRLFPRFFASSDRTQSSPILAIRFWCYANTRVSTHFSAETVNQSIGLDLKEKSDAFLQFGERPNYPIRTTPPSPTNYESEPKRHICKPHKILEIFSPKASLGALRLHPDPVYLGTGAETQHCESVDPERVSFRRIREFRGPRLILSL